MKKGIKNFNICLPFMKITINLLQSVREVVVKDGNVCDFFFFLSAGFQLNELSQHSRDLIWNFVFKFF